ncbi:hypothetical protein [Mesorhizobium sp.]|uniref:hypothetical protein n=1 Tax=Mesorhizobium sp. TaxID=1871066 RepID=UPI0025BC14BB|nr:hypothetical protein [Mesorhizobium sp.]
MSELTLLARLNKRVLHVNIRIGIGVDTDKNAGRTLVGVPGEARTFSQYPGRVCSS